MFEKLFQPISINGITLKNRFVMSPMWVALAEEDGRVSQKNLDHYARIADGGVAMIVVEATLVDPIGFGFRGELGIDRDECIPGLGKLAQVIRQRDAVPAIQLHHAGRYAMVKEPVSASDVPFCPSPQVSIKPRPMTKEEIKATIDKFAEAAVRAKKAGFQLVELHGGTGYLLTQFLSARTNKRTDEYGGPLENRMRFPLEVLKAVKEAVGDDFPVGYRFLVDELLPDGLKVGETRVFAKRLDEAGVAYLSVMNGVYESFFIPEMAKRLQEKGHTIPEAKAIKAEVSVPVFLAGRISDPKLAEEVISTGAADCVAMARVLFCDPQFPKKTKEGRTQEILECKGCGHCAGLLQRGGEAACIQWQS